MEPQSSKEAEMQRKQQEDSWLTWRSWRWKSELNRQEAKDAKGKK
jgi:hypothetical protein